jgi:hypothetical protein
MKTDAVERQREQAVGGTDRPLAGFGPGRTVRDNLAEYAKAVRGLLVAKRALEALRVAASTEETRQAVAAQTCQEIQGWREMDGFVLALTRAEQHVGEAIGDLPMEVLAGVVASAGFRLEEFLAAVDRRSESVGKERAA